MRSSQINNHSIMKNKKENKGSNKTFLKSYQSQKEPGLTMGSSKLCKRIIHCPPRDS